jgi:hypothetical protein
LKFEGGENLNFAIPINDAKMLLEVNSSKLLDFPDQPDSTAPARSHAQDASPSVPVAAVKAPASPRDYYQQLLDAGAFSVTAPDGPRVQNADYVCFNDDAGWE